MKHKKKQAVPTWEKLTINGETLEVLRVWQLNDTAHKWPETAILRAKTTGAKQQVENDDGAAEISERQRHFLERRKCYSSAGFSPTWTSAL